MSLEIKDAQSLVNLVVSDYKNIPCTQYSADERENAKINALIQANNGKSYLDIRDIRDGECKGLFRIIENILAETEYIGIENNPLFKNLVEYKSGKLGDKNEFYIPDSSTFYVSRIAEGTQALQRQRMSGGRSFSVDVGLYGVKIYEELNRLLAGRVDFNTLINKAIKSFDRTRNELILNTFLKIAINNPLSIISVTSNTYNEDDLMNLCIQIENLNTSYGSSVKPYILGTKKALRNITLDSSILAEIGKEDMYNMGYYGKFQGYDCIALPQIYKQGTQNGYLPDNVIWVIGSLEEKPVKFFTEGDPFVNMGNSLANADLSQDWIMEERFGADIIVSAKRNGAYTMTNAT